MPGAKDDDLDGFSNRFKTILDLVMNAIGDGGEVLVIDDQQSVRISLTMLLRPYYEVHTAENSTQALRILRERNIDLVTLDMNLPGLQGDKLLPSIRATRPGVEIIFLTSSLTARRAMAGIHHGVQDFFSKPFNTVDFLHATQSAIKKKKAIDGYVVLLKEMDTQFELETDPAIENLIRFVEGRKWIRSQSVEPV
jgi:DNA-binding NtrC family response regulator